jgi:hypothetical protein
LKSQTAFHLPELCRFSITKFPNYPITKFSLVPDYFNYFTEIEEHFCRRRGTVMLCSTLDWALMETWKQAGIPLEAVLRGIDAAFDRYDARPRKTRKINSLAYCAQQVLGAAEDLQEAAVGAHRGPKPESGLESPTIATFLERNAAQLESLVQVSSSDRETGNPALPSGQAQKRKTEKLPQAACPVVQEAVQTLRDLAAGIQAAPAPLEDLERRLTVIEEKLFAVLMAATADDQLVAVRADADRELAPYRRKMTAAQIDHLLKQYLHKRLLERYGIPRLSLFYM